MPLTMLENVLPLELEKDVIRGIRPRRRAWHCFSRGQRLGKTHLLWASSKLIVSILMNVIYEYEGELGSSDGG